MNQPWVYMRPPSRNPLPPPSPPHPSGFSQCTGSECPVLCIKLGLVICFTYGNIHVSVLFSQIIPPLPSPTESKSLFYTSVSLLLSRIQGYRYHLSKIHKYVFSFMHWRRKWQPTPVFLSGESQGWHSLAGCHLWGRTESDMTEVT